MFIPGNGIMEDKDANSVINSSSRGLGMSSFRKGTNGIQREINKIVLHNIVENLIWTNVQCLLDIDPKLKNTGKNCWYKCKDQGPCKWCGSEGFCCSQGWLWRGKSKQYNGCDGTFGGMKRHECALKPGQSNIACLFSFGQ